MEAGGIRNASGSLGTRSLERVLLRRGRHRIDAGSSRTVPEARPIRSVSVIGAGVMGQGIAAANVEHNIPVRITDVSSEALSIGIARILEDISQHDGIQAVDAAPGRHRTPLLRGTMSDAELAGSDLVVEAVVEKLDVKQDVLARLEPLLRDETLLASNTSCIPITQLAVGLAQPARLCGMHFCHPVRNRSLVEVVRGEKTSDQTVATAVGYAQAIGKLPIVVQDGPGFLVNRLLVPYLNEALELILEGASIESVEAAARSFGMSMGPITHFDAIGLDVAVRAGTVLYTAFPDRLVPSELLIALYKAGRLGQKSGGGFFSYPCETGKDELDPQVANMICERLRDRQEFTPEQLTMRLFLPMLVEATRVLEERLVPSAGHVDLGLIHGIGFPSSKGGLLVWADNLGAAHVVKWLKGFERLGKRYQATQMLLQMAKDGTRFYD